MFTQLTNKMQIISMCLLLSAWLPFSVQAGLYKSVDENGNVVYSQTPPASGDYQAIKIPKHARKQPLSSEESAAKRQKAREAVLGKEAANAKVGEETAAKKEEKLIKKESNKNIAERNKRCQQAREAKNKLEVFRRFRDKDGNVVRYSDEERATMLKNANDAIRQFCG